MVHDDSHSTFWASAVNSSRRVDSTGIARAPDTVGRINVSPLGVQNKLTGSAFVRSALLAQPCQFRKHVRFSRRIAVGIDQRDRLAEFGLRFAAVAGQPDQIRQLLAIPE